MSETEEPIVIGRDRDRAHKLIQIGLWAGLCGAIATGFLVAVGTSAPLLSAPVAEFVLRWAVVIGLSAVLLAPVYWEVR